MVEILPGWTPELERSFKEVLFRFLEEVHSTKAALYLRGPDGGFLLATQYGFGRREMIPARHDATAPLVLKALEGLGKPVAVNDQDTAPELAELFQMAGTTRLLVVPISGDANLAGFVDVRDKGQKRPFKEADLASASSISDDFLRLVGMTTLVSDVRSQRRRTRISGEKVPAQAVESGAETVLDEIGLEQMHRFLSEQIKGRSRLAAVAMTIMSGEHVGVRMWTALGDRDHDRSPLLHHQAEALRVIGMDPSPPDSWSVRSESSPCRLEGFGSRVIGTRVALERGDWALVLSVVGLAASDDVQDVVSILMRRALEASADSQRRFARRQLSLKLLSHQGRPLKVLEAHSVSVSRLAWATAQELGLGLNVAEDAALVGLLHDVGMRELDYDRLYRHPAPGDEERRIFKSHVDVGAKTVSANGLGGLAGAVRHHHERWDGKGYPDQLGGAAIPLLARIVHAAEVFDVLTSAESYRRPINSERALGTIQSEAGQQFDPAVVEALTIVVHRAGAVESEPHTPTHE